MFANPGAEREYNLRLNAALQLLPVIPLHNLVNIGGSDGSADDDPTDTKQADLLDHLMSIGTSGTLNGLRCTIALVKAHQMARGLDESVASHSMGGRSMLRLLRQVDRDAKERYLKKDPSKRGEDDAAGRCAMPSRYMQLVVCATKLGFDYATEAEFPPAHEGSRALPKSRPSGRNGKKHRACKSPP